MEIPNLHCHRLHGYRILGANIVEPTVVMSVLKRLGREVRDLLLRAGVGLRLKADNRVVLERHVFPRLAADPRRRRILFVGCHWYTWHYENLMQRFVQRVGASVGPETGQPALQFHTIDIDPQRARYGASAHRIGSVTELERHYDRSAFDCVMLIGVVGWGLDEFNHIDQALQQCAVVLRSGGELIVGVDDVPERLPAALESFPALKRFTATECSALQCHRHRCDGDLKHTLTFWLKTD